MNVVSNTSPIIAFSNLGKLSILRSVFGSITIPRGVYEELSERAPFRLEEWIRVDEIRDRGRYKMIRSELDHGESEAIVLYFEKNMDLLLLDDGEARKIAASYGIPIMGTGGILLVAKRKGLVGSLRAELEKLDREGAFRLSDAVKEMLLRSANE